MANRAPANPAPQSAQLCDYCHQKPKFANHQYCSKTCASQAATLCKHCNKKPKFQGFDYCGKHCAAQANANSTKPTGKPNANGSGKPLNSQNNNASLQPQSNTGGTTSNSIDPLQIAKLVAQHIPQVQALLATAQGQGSTTNTQPQPHSNNPFLNGSTGASTQGNNGTRPVPSSHGNRSTQPKPKISTKPVADDLRCLIPGCKQPVHVDEEGVRASNYCSLRHREQSVTMGIEEPCIMCLVLPQSDSDYFCSRACREESMRKHHGDDENSSEWSPVTVDSQD